MYTTKNRKKLTFLNGKYFFFDVFNLTKVGRLFFNQHNLDVIEWNGFYEYLSNNICMYKNNVKTD